MEHLHALDAAWLELEQPGPPIAIGSVSVSAGPAPSVTEVRTLLAARLGRMQRLTQRLTGGGRVRRPGWEQVEPDLRWHVQSRRVSAADGALDALVSGLMTEPMPPDRPLWSVHVVRGLADDRWALVWRVHHTVCDGMSSLALLGHTYDTEPTGGSTLAEVIAMATEAQAGEAGSSPSDHWLTSATHTVETGMSRLATLARQLPTAARVAADLAPRPPGPLTGELSDLRRYVRLSTDLATAKEAAHRHEVTVNDIVLTAVGEGFGHLLRRRPGLRLPASVRTLIPVSTRDRHDLHADNQVSLAVVDLPIGQHTGDADLRQRLRHVVELTDFQKQQRTPVIGAVLLGLADRLVPDAVQGLVVGHSGWLPAWIADTLVTNVPGPQFPLYLLGHRVQTLHPIIPIDGHLRIIVGVLSYDGALHVGVTGDGVFASDVHVLAEGIVGGLRALASG